MANEVRIRATVKDDASKPIKNIHDAWKRFQADGSKGVAIGAGAAVTAKALNAVQGAIEGVVHIGEHAVEVAIQQEHSIGKLNTSLKANVEGWNGNTAAIERTIHAHEALGFTDIEQRNSLALLVAATHDVNKALQVQSVAMDLARFKGISLQEASEALTKVEAGRFRILASLGIVLKDGATATDALAAVEKVAGGQAEEFASSTEGKLLVAQVKVNDAMEKFGRAVLPAVGAAAQAVAYELDSTTRSFDELAADAKKDGGISAAALQSVQNEAAKAGVSAEELYAAWQANGGNLSAAVSEVKDKVEHDLDGMANKSGEFANRTAGATAVINGAWAVFAAKSKEVSRHAQDDLAKIDRAVQHLKTDSLTAATDMVTGYYDVIILEDKLAAANAEISAQKRVLASKTATDAEKRDARVALHQAEADRAETIAQLAGAGATQSKVFTKTMKTLYKELQTAHGAEKLAIEAEIRRLQLLAVAAAIANGKVLTLEQSIIATLAKGGYVSAAGSITPKPKPPAPTSTSHSGARAAGGPVGPGFHGTVGELGMERLDIGADGQGYVTPMSGGGTSGSMSLTINVSAGAWSPGQAEQWARQVTPHIAREFQRQGLIAR